MTSTEAGSPRRSDDYCYRHPDRQSFVLCQRCLRTVCAECQTAMPVGVICPECLRAQRAAAPAAPRPRRLGRYAAVPVVTYAILGLTVLAFLADLASGGGVVRSLLWFAGPYVYPGSPTGLQPWRLLTVVLVHDGWLHLGLNMLVLFLMGRALEPLLGHARFLTLYLLSALGGSVAVALLAPGVVVVGASGAIFGLFGTMLIIGRHLGVSVRSIAILIAINFALPFVFAFVASLSSGSSALAAIQISWQAHLGGLVTGVGIGLVFARTRSARLQRVQIGLLVAIGVVLVALLALPPILYG